MKANQLRVGNLVQVNNETGEVLWFDHEGAVCQTLDEKCQCDMNIEPIEITAEWLLKLGFKYNKLQFCSNKIIVHQYKIKGICLSIDERKVNKHEYSFFGNNFIRTVKHVHQLQNLYFALTGEELKLK